MLSYSFLYLCISQFFIYCLPSIFIFLVCLTYSYCVSCFCIAFYFMFAVSCFCLNIVSLYFVCLSFAVTFCFSIFYFRMMARVIYIHTKKN